MSYVDEIFNEVLVACAPTGSARCFAAWIARTHA